MAVKLFVPPGHFYSPVCDPIEAGKHLESIDRGAPELPGIVVDRPAMVAMWQQLLPFLTSIPFTEERDPSNRYFFGNLNYSWGDASVLHAMIRHFKPKRLMEIGSGYSSACSLDTVEKYLGGDCELTFIDPDPASLWKLIGTGNSRVHVLEQQVQTVPANYFERLAAGDILFIDSTHVVRTGSDVCFELFEILPRLARGVIVHFHDMFWPFEYPRDWVVNDNRSWNESYAVRAFLTDNDRWSIIFFNDYFRAFEHDLIGKTYPQFLKNPGGALWLRRE
jgi:hypothetical protein